MTWCSNWYDHVIPIQSWGPLYLISRKTQPRNPNLELILASWRGWPGCQWTAASGRVGSQGQSRKPFPTPRDHRPHVNQCCPQKWAGIITIHFRLKGVPNKWVFETFFMSTLFHYFPPKTHRVTSYPFWTTPCMLASRFFWTPIQWKTISIQLPL